jgi:TIR domain/Domain of unknown function (DUF4384)
VSASTQDVQPAPAEVFISYARRDYEQVRAVATELAGLGVRFWLDQAAIDGGANYALAIARGIKQSRVLVLMCSDAALRSRNVNKEIMLAWKYERPYLPLLLAPVSYPEQVEYFLEGCQWIAVHDRSPAEWLPRVARALSAAGVTLNAPAGQTNATSPVAAQPGAPALFMPTMSLGLVGMLMPSLERKAKPRADLASLRALASFNDRIWPVPAASLPRAGQVRTSFRGLGAPQEDVQHGHKLGSRLGLAVESERVGHLLLLDQGPEGIIYCLCPSWFAPDTRVAAGRNYLPQTGARYDTFQVSGAPGREQLLAIITDEPLGLDWLPVDAHTPARVLDEEDLAWLLTHLRQLDPARWVAFATYFDVVP